MSHPLDCEGLGRQIRAYRRKLRMTQEQLARNAGISLSFLSYIERGTRKASIETLMNIAHVLNASLDDLLCDSLPRESEQAIVLGAENCFELIRKALDRLEAEQHRNEL